MKIPDEVLARAFQIYLDQRWPCKESFAKAIEYAFQAYFEVGEDGSVDAHKYLAASLEARTEKAPRRRAKQTP